MSVLLKKVSDRAVLAVSLLACLPFLGCAQWQWSPAHLATSQRGDDPAAEVESLREPGRSDPGTPADSAEVRSVLARSSDGQGHSVWIRAVGRRQDADPAAAYRWRYPALEELMARPAPQRPKFEPYLADSDPTVAGNAAIALARDGDNRGAERLADTVRAARLNLPMRCAAIEALAALAQPQAARLLRQLLDQHGRQTEQAATYNAQLHAELIRGLARHVDPADDRRFLDALGSRSPEVRLEAVEAWSSRRRGHLPDQAARLCEDADVQVRCAALLAVARRRHRDALARLGAGLHDYDVRVRTAAIAGLEELGGPESQARLEKLLKVPNELIRAAAVSELGRLGDKQAVLEAAGDLKWRVRLQAAKALARFPDRDGAGAARSLLTDPSAEVQRETVQALAAWPLAQAGPILLEAMASSSLTTRKTAADLLASRWPPAAEFQSQGSPDRRATMLDELRASFQRRFGLVDRAALAGAGPAPRPAVTITPEQLARAEQLIRQQDVQGLVGFGPGLVEALDHLVIDRQQVLPEAVYRDVLPQYDPVFEVLARLASPDVSQRRQAARELVQLASTDPPSRLAVLRLQQLVVAEPDQGVWRDVLTAVRGDASEAASRLAYAAISHPVPEVRRRACENLAAHPHPNHAPVLLAALEDRNHSVLVAAVHALGLVGRLEDTAPLRRLLATSNEELRLETAVALARLGDPAGAAELERLAYSGEPQTCRRVAQAMGDIADPSFTPTLIRLLDSEVGIARAALESLPKVVGHDPTSGDEPAASTAERLRRWKQWYQQQTTREAAASRRPL